MTIDPTRPGPAEEDRAGSSVGRVLGRLRRVGTGGPERPPERMRILTIGGRAIRVAVREGTPSRPPLLLCNGIGASLELFQPFVDALDPQPVGVDRDRAWQALLRDKKRSGDDINLVLLGDDGPYVEARPADEVRAALDSLIRD